MKIDITRDSFRRDKHYHDVRWPQGRIQLDADLNELADIIAYIRETTGRDVIGQCGAPIDDPGFEIRSQGKSPVISRGRSSLMIGSGRYYVNGILVENDKKIAFTEQDGFNRFPDRFSDPVITASVLTPGSYLAYLDVWQHLVTVLDDQEIREVALPCPDTSARTKTVWQVKLKKIDYGEKLAIEKPKLTLDSVCCDETFIEEVKKKEISTGRLNVRISPDTELIDPCETASRGGYQRLENQLYRVEIHNGGTLGEATFKWSRENGSVVVLWDTTDKNATLEKNADLLVNNPGGSAVTGFAPGDWVEVTDDERELCRVPGYFARLLYVDERKFTIDKVLDRTGPELTTGISITEFKNPKIRRWDSCKANTVEIPVNPVDKQGWIPLEDGVEIHFSNFKDEKYQTGDYWLIPARSVTRGVIWYPDPDEPENPYRKPDGPLHHFCVLAICTISKKARNVTDCRRFFKPLVCEPAIHVTDVGLNEETRTISGPPDNLNDRVVPIEVFFEGLYISFDRPIDVALAQPTFSVTADFPAATGFWPLNLDGNITSSDQKTIFWKPKKEIVGPLLQAVKAVKEKNILIHVSLKGNFIWGMVNDTPAYLDGEAFGTFEQGTSRQILSLPSGNFRKCSDFRMWFWLGAPKKVITKPT